MVVFSAYFCTFVPMIENMLNIYLDEIGNEQLLTAEEEQRLSARALKGDERAIDRLVVANLRFVVSIARGYQGRGLSMDDMVSEGNIGLLKAARKFDATRGLRFVNYAAPLVRQQIEKALAAESDEQRVESNSDGQTRSVDAPLRTNSNLSLLAVLADNRETASDERVYKDSVVEAIEHGLGALNDRERRVVTAYFGLGQERLTMAEIAEDMGLKRERVRQIRDKAVRQLRKAYRRR